MAGSESGDVGGILTLLDFIDRHRGAFEHDWRARFGMPLSTIPESMDWGEAWRITQLLVRDPSSWVFTAIAGWQYPLTREGLNALDLYDLQHRSKAKRKPKPHPRPWDKPTKQFGTAMSIENFKRLRARHQRRR